MSKAEKIAEVITAAQEFGPPVATRMIEDLLAAEHQFGFAEGRQSGFADDSRAASRYWFLTSLVVVFACVCIGHLIQEAISKAAALDAQELKACQAGDYSGCLAGYLRNNHGDEDAKVVLYISTYKAATGKDLVTVEQLLRERSR